MSGLIRCTSIGFVALAVLGLTASCSTVGRSNDAREWLIGRWEGQYIREGGAGLAPRAEKRSFEFAADGTCSMIKHRKVGKTQKSARWKVVASGDDTLALVVTRVRDDGTAVDETAIVSFQDRDTCQLVPEGDSDEKLVLRRE